jgi:hypothetical protein
MRTWILMILGLLLIAMPAAGQDPAAGYIGLFADPEGTDCAAFDLPGLLLVYVVHMDTPGATGSQFAIDYSGAPDLTFLSEAYPVGIALGTIDGPDGVSIGYGDCLTSPLHIATISFFASGLSAPCSTLRVIPAPSKEEILVVDCEFPSNFLIATGQGMYINPNQDCPDCTEGTVATETNSWGNLKSLYR